jgi:hypothetical protein
VDVAVRNSTVNFTSSYVVSVTYLKKFSVNLCFDRCL